MKERPGKTKLNLPPHQFLTLGEVCALARVSRGTVYKFIQAGQLKGYKLGNGRSWRFSREDVLSWICGEIKE